MTPFRTSWLEALSSSSDTTDERLLPDLPVVFIIEFFRRRTLLLPSFGATENMARDEPVRDTVAICPFLSHGFDASCDRDKESIECEG
jgi:hypothetical protein